MIATALMMLAALLFDRLLGEPRRLHPLVGFGRYAIWMEQRLNNPAHSPLQMRTQGILAWSLVVMPWLFIAWLAWRQPIMQPFVGVLMLYFALGLQSLDEHAGRIQQALQAGDLSLARQRVGDIVSRDTAAMQPEDVARAGVESVLENGNDAVFAALFWFAVAGAPGVLLYRLANTLDAMWGYRTPRFMFFGWATARLDDALNFIPARLTALTYALLGKTRDALRCWQQQAPAWDSPNAGPVMASGAGSLNIKLGGAADYHGNTEPRPALGTGVAPQAADISRAMALVKHGAWLWVALLLLAGLFYA
ncbi:MAG TPA: adenosylcobinamide-phosphate synthase CbiB [Gallionellaceae bacterium]|nr:adenosylcobinamide-phosphate synthase CbiB [Gallionellaceae bacterium]